MIKAVLSGNPNTGKSLLFSRITRTGAVSANYSGTTVETKTGNFIYNGIEYELIDGSGLYSLEEFCENDKTAISLLDECDIIINVIDATNLERNLNLTLQLIEKRKPMIVCLNFWEDTTHKGIHIDAAGLEKLLDVPVIPVSALQNDGIPELVEAMSQARISTAAFSAKEQWKHIGTIISKVQKLTHRHHTFLEILSDITLNPAGGILTAIIVLVSTLLFVRFIGEGLINNVFDPFYLKLYSPFIHDLIDNIHSPFIHDILIGNTVDPLQSFGILTSGVYIALVLVFPYFLAFYTVFGFLEDFGYLPRLAVVLDNTFHRLGLHGYSAIPVMLGLGCKVPAFLSTRILANRREKILTTSLIMMSAPCLPQTSMIISLGSHYGVPVVLSVFVILLLIAFITTVILNKFMKGESTDFFTELPSYRMPSAIQMARKLRMRVADYFYEVIPLIVCGVLIMNLLELFHILSFITNIIQKPVEYIFGLPADIAPIMVMGFLRKDASIALLAPLNLTAQQFIVSSIFLTLYVPCIASFFTLTRESGIGDSLKIMGIVFITASGTCAFLHWMFVFISAAGVHF